MLSVTHAMVCGAFNRSDGQKQVNNGETLMSIELTQKDITTAKIQSTGNGAEVRGLIPGTYLVMASLPISTSSGWYALSIGVSASSTYGNSVGEALISSNGYARLNASCFVKISSADDGIWVRVNSNAAAEMRARGGLAITRM